MDGMELSHFLHDNYPEIVIVIFSGFGEFEYAKKAIQYGVSEYLLKPVTAMELTGVIEKMKKKVEQQRLEKSKMDALAQNGIGARKYFYPLTNTFECFHGKYDVDATPVALHVAKRVLTLPLYADLSMEDVDRICKIVLEQKL